MHQPRLELGGKHVMLLGAEVELGASACSAKRGSCGRGNATAAGSTKRFQARAAIASRSAIVPVRRSPSTIHETSSGLSLLPMS